MIITLDVDNFDYKNAYGCRGLDAAEVLDRLGYTDAAEALWRIEYEQELESDNWDEDLLEKQDPDDPRIRQIKLLWPGLWKRRTLPKQRRSVKHIVFELRQLFGLLRRGEIYSYVDIGLVVGDQNPWSPSASNIINRARRGAAEDGIFIEAIRGVGYRRI